MIIGTFSITYANASTLPVIFIREAEHDESSSPPGPHWLNDASKSFLSLHQTVAPCSCSRPIRQGFPSYAEPAASIYCAARVTPRSRKMWLTGSYAASFSNAPTAEVSTTRVIRTAH